MNIRSTLAALALVAAAVSAPTLGVAQTTMTYTTYAPQAWASVQTDMWFMDEVEKRTAGKVKFERYFGGALTKPAETLPGIGQGVAQLGHGTHLYHLNLLGLSDVAQPYITSKADAAQKAFAELYETNKAVSAEYEAMGLKLLYAIANSEINLYSHKAIKKPADYQGLRIRALSGAAQYFTGLGASGVAIAWNEALDVFEKGGIDGLSSVTFDIGVSLGASELADHVSDAGGLGIFATVCTVMNLDYYNGLDPETKKIIDEVRAEAGAQYLNVFLPKVTAEAVEKLANRKQVEVSLHDPADRPAYEKVAAQVREKWIADMEAKGKPGREVMEQFISLVRKHEKDSTYVTGLEQVLNKRGQ